MESGEATTSRESETGEAMASDARARKNTTRVRGRIRRTRARKEGVWREARGVNAQRAVQACSDGNEAHSD
jgi:hypothetical protein